VMEQLAAAAHRAAHAVRSFQKETI